ncbi:MAG TPA: hypothetical protein VIT83_04975, partial [Gammaproteobacteria bacterium]
PRPGLRRSVSSPPGRSGASCVHRGICFGQLAGGQFRPRAIGTPVGFQFCYDKPVFEKTLTSQQGREYSHSGVDGAGTGREDTGSRRYRSPTVNSMRRIFLGIFDRVRTGFSLNSLSS